VRFCGPDRDDGRGPRSATDDGETVRRTFRGSGRCERLTAVPTRRPTVNRSLEALRGLAAIFVVAGHSRDLVYRSANITLGSPLDKLLLLPTSFAMESVGLFFVLSGYLVGGQVLRDLRADRFSARVYFIKRFSRLWFVMLAGLTLTVAADAMVRALFTGTAFPAPYELGGTVTDAGCNLVFLQDGRCAAFGSDRSLWSLGYEFWFYIVFAAVAALLYCLGRRAIRGAAVAGAVLVGALWVYGPHLLWLIPAWLLGVGIAELQRAWPGLGSWSPRWRATVTIGCLVLCACGMLASNVLQPPRWQMFLLVGLAASPLVLVLAVWDPTPPAWFRSALDLAAWLGVWSFTLYVFHLPLVVLLGVSALNAGVPAGVASSYALLFVATAACYPFYWLVEAHTARIRGWLLDITCPRYGRPAPRSATDTTEATHRTVVPD
jgi:peptidoglycan/LPS O-acetylase OafA/YrhL